MLTLTRAQFAYLLSLAKAASPAFLEYQFTDQERAQGFEEFKDTPFFEESADNTITVDPSLFELAAVLCAPDQGVFVTSANASTLYYLAPKAVIEFSQLNAKETQFRLGFVESAPSLKERLADLKDPTYLDVNTQTSISADEFEVLVQAALDETAPRKT